MRSFVVFPLCEWVRLSRVYECHFFLACPVVHRNHLCISDREVVPEMFVNQGGDPLSMKFIVAGVLDGNSVSGFLILLVAAVRRAVNRGWTFEKLRNAAEIADSDG